MTEEKKGSTENDGEVIREFIGRLSPQEIDLHRLFVEQTRQLHADVWNGVRFFLTGNAVVIAAIGVIYTADLAAEDKKAPIVGLSILGFLFTVAGLFILSKHRDYYLNGLVRKTLLEHALGFYEVDVGRCVEIVLPWSVPRSLIADVIADPRAWLAAQKWRWGTISQVLFLSYIAVLVIYVAIAVGALVADLPGADQVG